MRNELVQAINSYATARSTGDEFLINAAGAQLNGLLDMVFPPDEMKFAPDEEEDGAQQPDVKGPVHV